MKAQWLFEISTYKWSTAALTYGGNPYTAKVIPDSFSGISCRLDIGSSNLIAPSDATFEISNPAGAITRANVEGQTVTIRLIIGGTQSRAWKMVCDRAVEYYGKILIHCESILTNILKGTWPKTQHPKEIWPSDEVQDESLDSYTVPVILGSAYIPVAPVISSDNAYYVLGADTTATYTITEIMSPREWGNKSTWDNSYTYTQADLLSHKVVQPIIHDSDDDGTEDACGVWNSGGKLLYPLLAYSRDDTAALTSPEEWIEYILEDMGAASADIDAATFAAAGTIYGTRSITFNGGFWEKEERESVIKSLLIECDSFLYAADTIKLYAFDATSVETFTSADTLTGSFSISPRTIQTSDGARVEWVNSGDPQDTFTGKATVRLYDSQASVTNPADDLLTCRFISDSAVAQTAGILHFAKNYLVRDEISFETSIAKIDTIATIIPGQVITLNDNIFGASYGIILTELTFKEDFTVSISGVRLAYLEDWDDITNTAISVENYTEQGWVASTEGGEDGLNCATVTLYKRASSVPAVPSATATYTFATGVLTGHNNGWTQAIPAADGNPLYAIMEGVSSTAATIDILTTDWPTAVKILDEATKSAQIRLYKRSATSPALPTTSEVYTFSTGALTAPDGDWTQAMPATDGNPLWETHALASATSVATTDTILAAEWSAAVKILEDGDDGADGSTGANARAVNLTTASQGFIYTTAGSTPSPATATITATAFNTTGTVYYNFLVEGSSVQHTTANTYTYTPKAAYADMPDVIKVEIREGGTGNPILATDQITVVGIKAGSDSITSIFSNVSHTVPASSTGVVSSYAGSGSTLQIYDGTTLLTFNTVAAAGRFLVGTPVVSPTGKITVGARSGSTTTTCTVADHSGMDNATDIVTITYPVTLKKYDGTDISLSIVQTITKSKAGVDGDDGSDGTNGTDGTDGSDGLHGLTVELSNPACSIAFDGDNIAISGAYDDTGTTIKLFEGATALTYDGVGTSNGTWKVIATGTAITAGGLTDSGTYVTVAAASSMTDVTAYITFAITGKRADGTAISTSIKQNFSKVKYGSRSGGVFTFEESTDAYITAADVSYWDDVSFTNATAAANIARAVMAVSADGYIRPNDKITVTDTSANLAATRVYVGTAKNAYASVLYSDYSSLVVETFNGSVIVDGTLSASKLAADTTLTNNLIVGSYMTISDTGAIFTTGKTTYSDNDAGFWVGYDAAAYKLNIGTATNYLKWDGATLSIAGSITVTSTTPITVNSGGGITVNDGGDIVLKNTSNADPAKLTFKDEYPATDKQFDIYGYYYAYDAINYSNLYIEALSAVTTQLVLKDFTNILLGTITTPLVHATTYAYLHDLYAYQGGLQAGLQVEAPTTASGGVLAYGKGGTGTDGVFAVRLNSTAGDLCLTVATDKSLNVYGDIIPTADGTLDLGSTTYAFDKLFAQEISNPNGDLSITDNANVTGKITATAHDAFQARRITSDQANVAINSNVTIQFNGETNDHTNAFNTGTYTYTAQGNGWRQFNVILRFGDVDATSTDITVVLATSNEDFIFNFDPESLAAAATPSIAFSQLAYMDNGDTAYVKIYIYGGSATLDIKYGGSFFSGFYVND